MRAIHILLLLVLGYSYISPIEFETMSSKVLPPLFSKRIVMGQTFNGNQLAVFTLSKVSHSSLEELRGQSAVLISSEMHARQPYSVQLLQRIFEGTAAEGSQGRLDHVLERGVFVFFPFVNIDGYFAYLSSPDKQKVLRKNMNPGSVPCSRGIPGVDINRNFPSSFGTVPTSKDPCSEEFHGTEPFSEPEAKVFEKLFSILKIVVAIDVHSYGNEWIYPYASDSSGQRVKETKVYPQYKHLISQLQKRGSKIQSCLQSLNYIADGVYIDWALDQGALSLAFQIGRTFDHDQDISEQIQRTVEDFYLVIKTGLGGIQTRKQGNLLYLKSNYLNSVDVTIEVEKITQKVKLEPLGQTSVVLPSQASLAVMTIDKEEPVLITLSKSVPPSLFSPKYGNAMMTIGIVVFIILLFLLSLLGSHCRKRWQEGKHKRKDFYEMAEVSYRGELGPLQS